MTPLPSPRAALACLEGSSLRSILSTGTTAWEASAWPTITSALTTLPSGHEVILEPRVWGCANDVKPVCKSGLQVGRGSRGRRISLTVLRPVRNPLSQSTSKHLPCTAHLAALGSESKAGYSWHRLLAAADPDTGPENVPYPRTPPARSEAPTTHLCHT